MSGTFHCKRCNSDKALKDIAFRRDANGRSRRVCTECAVYVDELESRNKALADERDTLKQQLEQCMGIREYADDE